MESDSPFSEIKLCLQIKVLPLPLGAELLQINMVFWIISGRVKKKDVNVGRWWKISISLDDREF